MKLFTSYNAEMMDLRKIDAKDKTLVITGSIMRGVPVEVILTPGELRSGISMVNWKVVFTVIRMLFAK